jgi:DNA helicase-4
VAWKRQEHKRRGTALVETTSHQLRAGKLLDHLAKSLTERGITLDPNQDRPIPNGGQVPIDHDALVGLIRTFISHAKSNCLSTVAMLAKVEQGPRDAFKHRHRMFLELVAPIRQAWDAALAEAHGIDFEDMLNQAAEHVEAGLYRSPYELVMADEFQDASMARARLCRALVQEPGRHLFAVGDDWQSINRFAGADVSVMTGFKKWFGSGTELRLQQTFRCPQQLCDISSRFVSKNPRQIKKKVVSNTKPHGPVAQAFQVKERNELQSAINGYLVAIHQGIGDGDIESGRNGKVSVFVLGRYNADEVYVPPKWRQLYGNLLDVRFTTAHSSKGSEADYVIMPELVHKGFPNLRVDDPVLGLAMPHSDTFELAEERRLFYVALTRARRSVAMFTVLGKVSPFLDELVKDGFVKITDAEGEPVEEERCSVCKVGVIVERSGPYGKFRGCTNYPNCHNKPNAKPTQAKTLHPVLRKVDQVIARSPNLGW